MFQNIFANPTGKQMKKMKDEFSCHFSYVSFKIWLCFVILQFSWCLFTFIAWHPVVNFITFSQGIRWQYPFDKKLCDNRWTLPYVFAWYFLVSFFLEKTRKELTSISCNILTLLRPRNSENKLLNTSSRRSDFYDVPAM